MSRCKSEDYSDCLKQNPKARKAFIDYEIPERLYDEDTAKLMRFLKVDIEEKLTFPNLQDLGSKPTLKIKVVNDPVHGQIELHPLCCAIIDTPQFQRLRYLKQLGTTLFVYPSGSHSRFEHSIGVCHVAGELLHNLKKRQPEKNITNEDELCVMIAGLCHDLGHGPFSHVFGNKFIPRTRKDRKWKHEQASIDMLDHMFRDPANKLISKFREWGLKVEHYKFIREQIHPGVNDGQDDDVSPDNDDVHKKERRFLYEIVSNNRNGVDVDKWDYLARDCHHLGLTNSFDHNRFIRLARIIRHNGENQICVRDKEAFNVYEMFHMRHSLHRRVYQHKVCHSIDIMLVEALIKANDAVTVPGTNGTRHKIADCIDDMEAFTNLTDNVFHQILISAEDHLLPEQKENLREAKRILHSIQRRELYKCIYESSPLSDTELPTELQETDVKEEILSFLDPDDRMLLDEHCFYVQIVSLNFGKKDKNNKDANPVLDMRFYKKTDENSCVSLQAREVSYLIPLTLYGEKKVRVFTNFQTTSQQKDLLLKATNLFEENKIRKDSTGRSEDTSVLRTGDSGYNSTRDSS